MEVAHFTLTYLVDYITNEDVGDQFDEDYDPIEDSECKLCDKTFSDQRKLANHMKSHKCDFCGKNVKNKKSHINKMHDEDEQSNTKDHNCDFDSCNETFGSKKELNKHKKDAHDMESNVYKCDQCDKTFNNQPKLRYHKNNVHEKVKSTCEHCGKSFSKLH